MTTECIFAAQAGNTVDMDDDKLKLLGWGGRKAPTSLQAPGQARHNANRCYRLEAPREGEGRKRGLYQASESASETGLSPLSAPTDGGKVATYKIRLPDPGGNGDGTFLVKSGEFIDHFGAGFGMAEFHFGQVIEQGCDGLVMRWTGHSMYAHREGVV